jgi:hypothetical protein
MSRYVLAEAYSEIYDSRNAEDLFDNLRFIDYMLDEDIEEVVESLVWEFRDYGNTLDEAFNLLSYSARYDVISESYEQLVEDILTEATVTRGKDRAKYAGSAAGSVTYGRGDAAENARLAKKLAKQSGKSVADRLSAEAEQRGKTRGSRVDGAISRVKAAMAGAKGGMGRASKALGGAAQRAGTVAAGLAQKGKALLGSLLRKGVKKAGQAATAVGRSIEGSGKAAASAPTVTRTYRVPVTGQRVSVASEPSPDAGKRRSSVGRAIRKVGVALQRKAAGKSSDSGMTRADYDKKKAERDAAAKAAVGNAFSTPAKPSSETPTSSPRKYPTEPSGQTTLFTAPVKAKSAGIETKVPASGMKKFGATKRSRATGVTQKSLPLKKAGYKEPTNENINYDLLLKSIAEDLVKTEYASTIDEAYDVIDNLDENTLAEIISEYLD